MKLGPPPEYTPLLKNFQIPPDFKVYKLRGERLTKRKLYEEAQEYKIHVTDSVDITDEAKLALDSVKAYYAAHNDWPTDDNF